MRIFKYLYILLTAIFLTGCGNPEDPSEQVAELTETITKPYPQVQLVQPDGGYPRVALEKDTVVLAVIQSGVRQLSEFPTLQEGLDHNLNYMKGLAEEACSQEKKPDILLFHEFPLTGYYPGSRTDKLKFTVEIPGAETARLGEVAKACDAYLIFGSYATDKDWPGHILSINAMLGRDGKLVKSFWKARNIKRLYEKTEITTTTIESVRDKYRQMYGIEEEFPVVQTEFGNIAVSTVQRDPFIFAAYAMRGVEIMLRTATLYAEEDVTNMAMINNFYSAMSNITFPDELGIEGGGNSIIVDPGGDVMSRLESSSEDGVIYAEIPIAAFRKNRKIPSFAIDVVRPVLDQYVQEIPLNHMDLPREKLPETGEEMRALFNRVSRFLN